MVVKVHVLGGIGGPTRDDGRGGAATAVNFRWAGTSHVWVIGQHTNCIDYQLS